MSTLRTLKIAAAEVAAFFIAALLSALAVALLPLLLDWLRDTSESVDTVAIGLGFFLPIALGLWAALRTRKRLRQNDSSIAAVAAALGAIPVVTQVRAIRLRRAAWLLVALLYFVTWAFGVPAVQSRYSQDEISLYKRLEAKSHGPEWKPFPTIRTQFALPILPGTILCFHEYVVAGLWGWGGWSLHLWYVT